MLGIESMYDTQPPEKLTPSGAQYENPILYNRENTDDEDTYDPNYAQMTHKEDLESESTEYTEDDYEMEEPKVCGTVVWCCSLMVSAILALAIFMITVASCESPRRCLVLQCGCGCLFPNTAKTIRAEEAWRRENPGAVLPKDLNLNAKKEEKKEDKKEETKPEDSYATQAYNYWFGTELTPEQQQKQKEMREQQAKDQIDSESKAIFQKWQNDGSLKAGYDPSVESWTDYFNRKRGEAYDQAASVASQAAEQANGFAALNQLATCMNWAICPCTTLVSCSRGVAKLFPCCPNFGYYCSACCCGWGICQTACFLFSYDAWVSTWQWSWALIRGVLKVSCCCLPEAPQNTYPGDYEGMQVCNAILTNDYNTRWMRCKKDDEVNDSCQHLREGCCGPLAYGGRYAEKCGCCFKMCSACSRSEMTAPAQAAMNKDSWNKYKNIVTPEEKDNTPGADSSASPGEPRKRNAPTTASREESEHAEGMKAFRREQRRLEKETADLKKQLAQEEYDDQQAALRARREKRVGCDDAEKGGDDSKNSQPSTLEWILSYFGLQWKA